MFTLKIQPNYPEFGVAKAQLPGAGRLDTLESRHEDEDDEDSGEEDEGEEDEDEDDLVVMDLVVGNNAKSCALIPNLFCR